LINADENKVATSKAIENELQGIVRKYIVRTKRRYPIITPVVFMA
jgi:mRNA degradation ribonuclease J1/J2